VTHPALSLLDEAGQRSEIEGSRRACEELIGAPVHTFAYPFGDFDDTAIAWVRGSGVTCACTTQLGKGSMPSHPLRVPRLAIGNWAGDDLARRLTIGPSNSSPSK